MFFMTTAPLTSADFDKSYDVYDAHECTATSPCIPPPPAAGAECVTAEACRSPPPPRARDLRSPGLLRNLPSGIGDLPGAAAPGESQSVYQSAAAGESPVGVQEEAEGEEAPRFCEKASPKALQFRSRRRPRRPQTDYLRTCSLI